MISHNKPTLGKEEEHAALRVVRSNWLAPGKEVIAFENEVCCFLGLPDGYAVAVANGTSALFLALWVLKAPQKKIAYGGHHIYGVKRLMGGPPPFMVYRNCRPLAENFTLASEASKKILQF